MLAVAAGAALGGVLRFVLTQLVVLRAGPALAFSATLAINVTGSFAIGIVAALAAANPSFSPTLRLFLTVGVLGGYTTFSSFALEVVSLANGGAVVTAVVYALASVALGVLAAVGGLATGRALAH